MFVRGAPDLHVLWGWLQVGAVIQVGMDPVPEWASGHPHVASPDHRRFNTVYQASDSLTLGGMEVGASGAGVFRIYRDNLRLTAPGKSRGRWSLPRWFLPTENRRPLGYHADPDRWSADGDQVLLRTVGRGQEFVLDMKEYPEAAEWVRELHTKH